MVTNYNPNIPNLRKLIHHNCNIIENSPDCGTLSKDKPIVGFRRLPNLIDNCMKAIIAYPKIHREISRITPTVFTRLGKCTYCPLIKKDTHIL